MTNEVISVGSLACETKVPYDVYITQTVAVCHRPKERSLTLEGIANYFNNKLRHSLDLGGDKTTIEDLVELFEEKTSSEVLRKLLKMFPKWGESRYGVSWLERAKGWSHDTVLLVFNPHDTGRWVLASKSDTAYWTRSRAMLSIPIFRGYIKTFLVETKKLLQELPPAPMITESYICDLASSAQLTFTAPQETKIKGKEKMKFLEKLKTANVDAAKLAGQLTVGKAANKLLADAVVAKLPWYSRMFSGSALRDSSVAKLATANLAVLLANHFASDNKELEYVTEAMLQDAMVELLRDSDQVQSILNQLAGLAGGLTKVDAAK